ncbi:hypothetical protein CROQUDRAFT_47255 [Cronartium quercuum f. sp. fusiforme G11]|uniref:Uncharacterized protein n=1 Tax=Cronartium quercuum f. sp. fusiforme G11 TaxID=708437 RepID=A0A9P6NHY5_9BASI|nr:hypothetical protein CROQUDRAFT_47255 [Cronartium quercuum f. sp. fusiforme G11]
MLDPSYDQSTQSQEPNQLEEDENRIVDIQKPSRASSTIHSKRLSRAQSRDQFSSGSVLSLHAPHHSLSSRSSRAHLEYDGENNSAASSVRRKPKGTNGSLSPLGMAESHVAMSSGGGSRQSLAFELAAAMDPEETDQSSILDKLGLGDGDEDDEVSYGQEVDDNGMDEYTIRQDEEVEEAEGNEHRTRKTSIETRSSGLPGSLPGWHEGFGPGSPAKSMIRDDRQLTPTTRQTRRSSRSTVNTTGFSPRKSSFAYGVADEYGEETEEEDFEDMGEFDESDGSETDEERARTVLEAGLVSTAHFLAVLKQSNTDYIPSATGLVSDLTTEESTSDRQPAVEKLIVDLVRTMADTVREREAQIRELKEIEVALSHTDRRALAEVESLPMMLEDADFRSYIVGKMSAEIDDTYPVADEHETEVELTGLDEQGLAEGQITPLAHHGSAQNLRSTSVHRFDSLGYTRKNVGSRIVSTGAGPHAGPMNQLDQLKLVTTSLINSLNLINEHTQIGRQTQTEVVRKLKGVRGLVTNWKADHDSLENSKECISRWESELGLDDPSTGKVRGKFEVQIKLATTEAEKLLEDASEQARFLLRLEPIST